MTLAEAKRAVVLAPDDADARCALAERFFVEGQHDAALTQLEKALQLAPLHKGAHRLKRQVEREKKGEGFGLPENPAEWPKLARSLVDDDRYDDAILVRTACLEREPNDPDGLLELAEWCVRQRLHDRARLVLGRGLRLTQRAPRLLEVRDHLLAKLGEDDSFDLLCDGPEGLVAATEALLKGELTAAKRALALADPLTKAEAAYDWLKAEVLLADGEPEKAAAAEKQGRAKAPKVPWVAGRLAQRAAGDHPGKIGVLGWTPFGGAVSPMEAVAVPGQGTLQFTGNVGPTGREAGQIAYTCLKAQSASLGIDGLVRGFDLHLHFTDTEFGKEGTSSGLALTLAGISAFKKRPLRRHLGATGAITLHGEVQRIEGLHEKVVAAWLAGLDTVLIPRRNLDDARKLPALATRGVNVVPVSTLAEALDAAWRPA